jgi:hypothetical protein
MKSLTIEIHEFDFTLEREAKIRLLWKLCDFGWTIEHWRDMSSGMVCIRIIQP